MMTIIKEFGSAFRIVKGNSLWSVEIAPISVNGEIDESDWNLMGGSVGYGVSDEFKSESRANTFIQDIMKLAKNEITADQFNEIWPTTEYGFDPYEI